MGAPYDLVQFGDDLVSDHEVVVVEGEAQHAIRSRVREQ